MKLPNGDKAVVAIEKLRDYCLNVRHQRGRHKARVFAATLELTADNAEWLHDLLIEAARHADAVPTERDAYGQRYTVDCSVQGRGGPVRIRSNWIVRCGEDFPRLTSCFVL
jgi:hypothetical protein